MNPLAGLTRTASRAVGGIALDISSGLARAAEATRAAIAGETIGPATLRVQVVILSDEAGSPLTTPAAMPAVHRPGRHGAHRRVRDPGAAHRDPGDRRTGPGAGARPAGEPGAAARRRARPDRVLPPAFRRRSTWRRRWWARPITVIVVRNIAGRVTGCSLGISADWVIVPGVAVRPIPAADL